MCEHDGVVTVSIKDEQGERSLGTFEAPLTPGDMPALMGRVSLERQRTLLDFVSHKVYFLGPGDYQEQEYFRERWHHQDTGCYLARISKLSAVMRTSVA